MEHQSETYEVQLAGVPMRLKTAHDPVTVEQLVTMVNEKVEQILKDCPNISFQKALLLTALHMAEDSVTVQRQALNELDGLETKAKAILSELESSPISKIRMDN